MDQLEHSASNILNTTLHTKKVGGSGAGAKKKSLSKEGQEAAQKLLVSAKELKDFLPCIAPSSRSKSSSSSSNSDGDNDTLLTVDNG